MATKKQGSRKTSSKSSSKGRGTSAKGGGRNSARKVGATSDRIADTRQNLSGTKRILNVIPSRDTDKDWYFDNAIEAGIVGAPAALPPSKDMRELWWKINDQGSTGACVGWATADGVVRWHFVKAGLVPQNKLLSPRFVWMASKETDEFTSQPTTFIEDEGTSLKAALDIVRKYGEVLEEVLPFKTGKLYPNPAKTFYALAARLKIASYFNLGGGNQPGALGNWRTWLATHGPIITRLDVDATWDGASATGGRLDLYQPATTRGGHAVTIVGYTLDRFIIRNSWGTTWGDAGFGYASFGYAQAAFTEAYGVSI
jgi:hypothetical protein